MRLIYFGTAAFAVPCLRRLAPFVELVVSQPDRPTGRGLRMQPSPVKQAALELGLAVETPEKSRAPEFVETLRALDADALVVAAYGQILSQKLLDSARRGGINLHGSILPLYRGAAPIQRAIFEGETETGVSLMQMDKGMDTGDVIDIAKTKIGDDETYGELAERLAVIAADLAESWIERIVAGNYQRIPQDHDRATHAAKVAKSEARLNPANPVELEYRRFRAFYPSPGPFFETEIGPWRIHACRRSHHSVGVGRLEQIDGDWHLGFADGSLRLITVQPAGRRAMSAADAMRGTAMRSVLPEKSAG